VDDGEIAYEYEAGHCRPFMALRLWNYQILHCVLHDGDTVTQTEGSSVVAYSLLLLIV
jgi:hypothetical protein